MTERFLQNLAAEAAKTLRPHEVASLVAEAREHLDDSMQARLELGCSREDAEREALAAFGRPSRLVQDIRRQSPWFDRAFVCALACTAMAYGVAVVVSDASLWAFPAVFCLLLFANVAFIRASIGARRIQIGRLFVLALICGIATRLPGRLELPEAPDGSVLTAYSLLHALAWRFGRLNQNREGLS